MLFPTADTGLTNNKQWISLLFNNIQFKMEISRIVPSTQTNRDYDLPIRSYSIKAPCIKIVLIRGAL